MHRIHRISFWIGPSRPAQPAAACSTEERKDRIRRYLLVFQLSVGEPGFAEAGGVQTLNPGPRRSRSYFIF